MLTARVLNRTLLKRQHLLERTTVPVPDLVEHLVGLQAQDTLPPYVGLWARLEGFDPHDLSRLLEQRAVSRIVLMRGTIHLVTTADCLGLRPLLQERLEQLMKGADWFRRCADVDRGELTAAASEALGAGPLDVRALGVALAERFPGHAPGDLVNTVRLLLPLLQTPPRGLWKRSGLPTYAHAESWHGSPLVAHDPADVLRRYLRAFGPASAADVTTWSGLTGIRSLLAGMSDELVEHRDEQGRTLYDLEGLELAAADEPAPVRLLGKYDNLWLSHADRSRVTEPGNRAAWTGRNGGTGATVFVDGMLEGLWREVDGRVEVELFRTLTRAETAELEAEVAALEGFLAR